MAEVTYHFNAYTVGVWTLPDNIVDGDIGTFGYTNVKKTAQTLTGNNCPGADLGTITKVEIRLFGKGDGDDRIDITPVFTGGNGDTHETVPVVDPGGWVAYVDITDDTNHPDWSLWSHIQTLDCIIDSVAVAKANTLYCSKVEIRVTYTPYVAPTVTTQRVTNIEQTTATGHGNITATGGQNCSKRGVCWNTTGSPTVADDKSEETDSFGTGAFSRAMTGLTPGEHYYVRAYAYNSAGYGYGSQVEFISASVPSVAAMEQVIFGGEYDALPIAETQYNSLVSGELWDSTEFNSRKVVSTSGKIKNLRVKLDGAPGAGKSWAFTLMLNGVPSALTLTIADDATSGADTTHEVDVVAGDTISLECDPSAEAPAADTNAAWTSVFGADTAKESLILGGTSGSDNLLATYFQVMTAKSVKTMTENDRRQVCPTSGKIKNLFVEFPIDPGTAPDAFRITLRVNGANSDDGEGNPLQVTIVADDKIGNDTTHEIPVSAGDVLTLMIEPVDFPAVDNLPANWGMTFVADINGESVVLAGNDLLDDLATSYNYLQAKAFDSWIPVELFLNLGQSCTLKKLYMLLSAAPGDGKSYTFNLRKPGNGQVAGNLTVTITGGAVTTGNDTVNTDVIVDDDYVDLECTPANTPTALVAAYWGVVCYIEPPPAVPENTIYLVKATGRRTQLAAGAEPIRIDPTTGRRSLDTTLTKFLVREDDGTLRAKSA